MRRRLRVAGRESSVSFVFNRKHAYAKVNAFSGGYRWNSFNSTVNCLSILQVFRFVLFLVFGFLTALLWMSASGSGVHFVVDRVGASGMDEGSAAAVSEDRNLGGVTVVADLKEVVQDPRWYVEEYMERFRDSLNCRRFKAMAVDGSSLFIYDRNRIKHDTCVGAWRRRRGALDRNKSMMMTVAPLADMPFVRCEGEFTYCQKLPDMMSSAATVEQGSLVDSSLWLFGKPYTRMHLFHGGRHRTRVLELEVRQRSVARHAFLLRWHNVEVFAVLPAERAKYHVSVPHVWRDIEPPYELGVPTPLVLSYYSGEVLKRSPAGSLAMRIAMTEFVISTLVCFLRCAPVRDVKLFYVASMRATHSDQGFLVPLPSKKWQAIDEVGLFCLLEGCEVDVPRALVACARAREVD